MTRLVFQFNCKTDFRIYEALQNRGSESRIVASPNKDEQKLKESDRGAKVYLWEAGNPYRGLVASGIMEEPLGKRGMPTWQHNFRNESDKPTEPITRSIIRIDYILAKPMGREELLADFPILRDAIFFGNDQNPQGTIFRIRSKRETSSTEKLVEALDELMRLRAAPVSA